MQSWSVSELSCGVIWEVIHGCSLTDSLELLGLAVSVGEVPLTKLSSHLRIEPDKPFKESKLTWVKVAIIIDDSLTQSTQSSTELLNPRTALTIISIGSSSIIHNFARATKSVIDSTSKSFQSKSILSSTYTSELLPPNPLKTFTNFLHRSIRIASMQSQ